MAVVDLPDLWGNQNEKASNENHDYGHVLDINVEVAEFLEEDEVIKLEILGVHHGLP